jgi:hypothetical protein
MNGRKAINWKSVPDMWPKPGPELAADLHGAVVLKTKPAALRFHWKRLLWAVASLAQSDDDSTLFESLRHGFLEGPARQALVATVEAQRDIDAMTAHTEEWERGPWTSSAQTRWLTPFHPGIELLIYARVVRELGQQRMSAEWVGQLHLKRRAAVAQFTKASNVPYAREARAQQLAGWVKFVDSRATAIFGFAPLQRWAEAEIEIATSGKVGSSEPPT